MPRKEHVLTVFVASPSDVGDERTKLEEVIRELNDTWSRNLGLRLELVRWETHAIPGIGIDPQDVINEQIPDDYDLFICIMWCRYGTPTGRSGSGTVEEFERAKARYDADSSSVKLMVYFKDAPIRPSKFDPAQLSKVNEFRDSLRDKGVLYRNFNSVENFESLIRMHLIRQIQEWSAQLQESEGTSVLKKSVEQPTKEPEAESEDEFGFLDLFEIFEDRFAELVQISDRIAEATQVLGDKTNVHSTAMNELSQESQGNVSAKTAKRLISRAAADINHYTSRIEAEFPLFSDAISTGMNAIMRGLSMYADSDSDETGTEQYMELLEAFVISRESLKSTEESMSEFRQKIADLPRITSKLNRAKRGAVSALDRLIAEFSNGRTLLRDAETVIRDFPGVEDA